MLASMYGEPTAAEMAGVPGSINTAPFEVAKVKRRAKIVKP